MDHERTFVDVTDALDRIVELCREEQSALGVFPAMYRTVTTTVGDGIRAGLFDDPARVEQLVITFAGLYIDAFDTMRGGRAPAAAWDLAFTFAQQGRGSICQHLLLGMNAHINLDLGQATAASTDPADLDGFEPDFIRVNDVLFALVDELQDGLDAVSPWMRHLDRVGLSFDEALMRSGIARARSGAWRFGEALAAAPLEERPALIAERDAHTRRVGQVLCHRLSALHLANRVVARRECQDRRRIIDELGRARIDVVALLG